MISVPPLNFTNRLTSKGIALPWYQIWLSGLIAALNGSIISGNLPVYANNAAAIAGGMVVGSYYRTGGDPDPVCVVHL